MRFLFIKPKQIGDSLILTPTLTAAKQAYPGAQIWILIREGCEAIMAGCPAIDRVLTIAPVEMHERKKSQWLRDARTLFALRKVKFDFVFELGDGHRGRWFSLLCRRGKCYSVKPATPLNRFWRSRFDGISSGEWEKTHRIEKDYMAVHEFLPLPQPPPPMVFEKARAISWEPAARLGDFAILNVGTRQEWNRWDRESWLKVGRHLLGKTPNLVITCGPVAHEIADSEWLREQLGDRVLCTLGKASWSELADLFYRARLLVCPNTAAMHLAAACRCPTVAMFGRTSEVHWHPWHVPHRIVTSSTWIPGVDDPHDFQKIESRLMKDVSAESVITACNDLLAEIRGR